MRLRAVLCCSGLSHCLRYNKLVWFISFIHSDSTLHRRYRDKTQKVHDTSKNTVGFTVFCSILEIRSLLLRLSLYLERKGLSFDPCLYQLLYCHIDSIELQCFAVIVEDFCLLSRILTSNLLTITIQYEVAD